ncbi:alpha/beta hydrolase [Sphingomonas sp. C8-2]|nr:alpha/beta hydrolase [Sphingomonas sp. C8-2]
MSTIELREGRTMAVDDGVGGTASRGGRGAGWLRRAMLGCAAFIALAPAGAAEPGGKGAQVPSETLAEFARPHQLVDIGGRKLNLFCMGAGPRTVLFDAGGSDWSVIWALVLPEVAKHARACAYDRAGLGYSDPAAGPRSPIAIVEDLHALIRAAGIETPLVLVGHSLGGFHTKLYARLYPEDVAGLVLIDPAEERSSERVRALLLKRYGASLTARLELRDNDGLGLLLARFERCVAAAKDGDLDPQSPLYRRCSDPVRPALGPAIAAERARIQVTRSYQEIQGSEVINSVYGKAAGDPIYAALFRPGVFGNKPLIVLTHGRFDADDPFDVADFQSGLWLHEQTAALSRRGRHRVVPDTSHNIEIDDPAAVIDAVVEVLGSSSR